MDKSTTKRLMLLFGLFAGVMLIFLVTLFDTQIIHGDEYLAQSIRSIAQKETVESSRGLITDRNGKLLVSNRLSYTITFDSSLLEEGEDVNAAILRLLQLLEQRGVDWNDNLPIEETAPFAYTTSYTTATQLSRLSKFLQKQGWSEKTLTADDPTPDMPATRMMGLLREYFDIDPTLSTEDARKIIGVRYELAIRKLVNTTEYILVDDVDTELIAELTDGAYAGVVVDSAIARQYETAAAAHVLGYVGRISDVEYEALKGQGYGLDDLIGKSGVEASFEQYLRGTDGEKIITTNSEGIITGEEYSIEPQPGNTVALTIDLSLQEAVEAALAKRIEEMTRADGILRAGAAAVVQVGTGEILSLASYPTFSLATLSEDIIELNSNPLSPMYNRATKGTYAPGSTFKPVTALAALETGIITPSTKILTQGRYTYYKDYQPRCWLFTSTGGNHGLIDVAQAITDSCNYFFYDVGRQTGITAIAKYASLFGLGESTGIELEERIGHMTTPDYVNSLEGNYWTDGLTLAASIGQSVSEFTPLQLANYISTLVSGGDRYAAHLLKNVKSYDGSQLIYDSTVEGPVVEFDLDPDNLKAVMEGMHELVLTGSVASYFADCVVDAGAKTGTAQTTSKTSNGVFVCFAPYDDPEIAMAIVIEKGGSGGALASVAVDILNSYFSPASSGSISGENQLIP